MADFQLVPCDTLLARIEDELSSLSANALLDTGKLYTQLKWFAQKFGLAVFEQEERILKLENHRAELPCDFYLLDSAWLCDANPQNTIYNFQAKSVVYTEIACSTIENPNNCYLPNNGLYPLSISACNMENVLNKTVTKEYVLSGDNSITWKNPILLRLNNKKSVKQFCAKECQNMFSHFPEEISISKQGDSYYLYSTLKCPVIYTKYYKYPYDENGLPMIPDDQILQEAIFWHLVAYILQMLWLNSDETDLENKIKYANEKKAEAMADAMYLVKLPSFNHMVQLGRRMRTKFASFEIMNTRHF